jgi:exodeoxyribonuclease V alpha subunit
MLHAKQALALELIGKQAITVICGGPGTGKSYLASELINLIDQTCLENVCIKIAAPTGKAAFRLREILGNKAWKNVVIEDSTLHSLLQMPLDRKESFPLIDADIIIIDEASMIDSYMMSQLFQKVSSSTRLVLIGDPHQLPPIETGHIFYDLVYQKRIPTVELQKNYRTQNDELADVAKRVLQHDVDNVMQMIENPLYQHIQMIEEKEFETFIQRFFLFEDLHFDVISQRLTDFRFLSCMRKGPWGVETLNEKALAYVQSQRYGKDLIVPIIITKNDRILNIYNGMMGIWVGTDLRAYLRGEGTLYFIQADGSIRKISAKIVGSYSLSFCLSVHKSQGSEFNHVFLFLPEQSEKFGSEILYTGITRAKKQIFICAQKETLIATMKTAQQILV